MTSQLNTPRIVIFAMPDFTHFRGILILVESLVRVGIRPIVFTSSNFKAQIELIGGQFVNLFETCSVESVDNTSRPYSARYITFSVLNAHEIAGKARTLNPDIILADGFALIGRLVSMLIKKPFGLINSGHLCNGETFRQIFASQLPAKISDNCLKALAILDREYQIGNSSPFSFVADPSDRLNIHLEPQEWRPKNCIYPDETAFYFGCLQNCDNFKMRKDGVRIDKTRIYAAFGTIIWRYWTKEALSLLDCLAEIVKKNKTMQLTIALGGADISPGLLSSFQHSSIRVLNFANQNAELDDHDIFLTHNGMSSTHEAVRSSIAMMSWPFFGDQHELADFCNEFGLSEKLNANNDSERQIKSIALEDAIFKLSKREKETFKNFYGCQAFERAAISLRSEIGKKIISVI